MPNFLVRKVAVLGAGVMGAQIAAHCVNARVPVVLFDLPAREGPKSGIADKAIGNLRKLSPPPLGTPDLADLIEAANYEEDLRKLGECDLVIEAIAERMDWKHGLYAQVAPHIAPHAIFATNTSGLSIAELARGMDEALLPRFCGVHFFNPPRYMHLVELIPTAHTEPAALDRLEAFLTSTLGKGVVRARDTPNFIGNRVGMFGIVSTMIEAEKFGLGYDVVDDLTGAKLGRARSGTYRTGDVVGLDTFAHVIKTMEDGLPDDPFAAHYGTPPVLAALVAKGALGQKTGAGYFRKEGKAILRLDPASGDYVPADGKADGEVARMLALAPAERLRALHASPHPQAQFLWAMLRDFFHYSAVHLADIADTARDVDFAMRWGFGHGAGPFELWQEAGWLEIAQWISEDIAAGKALSTAPLPEWATSGPVARAGAVHTPQGSWNPRTGRYEPRSALPVYARQILRAPLAGETAAAGGVGRTLFEDASLRLWTVPREGLDDVLVASLKTRGKIIDAAVAQGLLHAVDLAERDYRGLVIWNGEDAFSPGMDMALAKSGAGAALQALLQQLGLRLRGAQVPTVAAIAGAALGAGCQLALACARRVAHLESALGLNEATAGLPPGTGGLAWIARRAAQAHEAAPDAALADFLLRPVAQAAQGQASRSAIAAREMGYLGADDAIVFNVYELLYSAIRAAQALAEAGWRAPWQRPYPVAGASGAQHLQARLENLAASGGWSAEAVELGRKIAAIVCGADAEPGAPVDDGWMLARERQAWAALAG